MPNHGQLTITVWPPYVGVTQGDPGPGPLPVGEPVGHMDYNRAMVAWRTCADGTILGAAQVFAPKGVYTHIVFLSGPGPEHPMMGYTPFEQPIVFDRSGIIDIDPIQNQDYLPREGG